MTLRLYNTLTRRIEPFVPQQPVVSFYTCGPTVYNYAHIGNFRTFLFEDLLRRWLEAKGMEVFHIMNLTDVDDKTIRGAREAGVPLREHVQRFVEAFHEDCAYLRLLDASVYPRATDYIGPMIRLVESLLAKEIAYRGEDGSVYFAIGRFPDYGRLSQLDRRELRAGASERVSADEYAKEDARDFVLWKAAKPEDEAVGAAWDAPFGRGRPGWHLECSAMALDLIGERLGVDVLDLHAGGVDLIFPHHEDEIAQSCAHTGKPEFARVWLHGEFLTFAGTKMSKRFGNILTARDLREEGIDAGAVRLLLFGTHYRQKLDWTDESLMAAREGSRRLGEFEGRMRAAAATGGAESPELAAAAGRLETDFSEALDEDLNAPRAVASVFDFVREANRLLDGGAVPGEAVLKAWKLVDRVLAATPARDERDIVRIEGGAAAGVGSPGPGAAGLAELDETPPAASDEARRAWAVGWAQRRLGAKRSRDFKEADRIRELLKAAGFEVRDARDGSLEVVRIG
jgi:cysteinyl-tRNA synthetase